MPAPGKLGQTPSQTVGPYFAYGLTPEQFGYDFASIITAKMAGPEVEGAHIHIAGCVFDGAGKPITDAMIEIWQADAQGRYPGRDGANSRFTGFGRCGTNADGAFSFATVKPGIARPDDAPFINVTVMMRGLLLHVFTRLYFSDEVKANASDPVLALVPAERRSTLIAHQHAPGKYRFDIHMQGAQETVFFDL